MGSILLNVLNYHEIKFCAGFLKNCLCKNPGETVAEGCCLKIMWLLMELDAHLNLKETVREL